MGLNVLTLNWLTSFHIYAKQQLKLQFYFNLQDLRLSTAEEETKDGELKCSKHLPNGAGFYLLCEWNCAPLPALFSNYILACYYLCRHFPTLPNFSSCLRYSVRRTVCLATVLFGCPLKFSFRLGVLKHVSASVTVDRGVHAGVVRTGVFVCFVD